MGIAIKDETLTQPDPNDLGTALLFHFDLATVALRLRLRTKGKNTSMQQGENGMDGLYIRMG